MKDDFYRQMMNRGFLIFEAGGKFMLVKIPTPADPRPSITDAVQSNTSEIEFKSWEEAITKAEFLCQENPEASWSVQMMVGHKLGVKIVDLDPVTAATWKEAKLKAERLAADHVENDFEKGSFDKWEVKIKPFKE